MTGIEKVLDRVRKLLKLSKSDNEHEAANAANQAAKLMAEYNLSEAMIRVDDASKPSEPIIEGARLEDEHRGSRKKVAWKGAIAASVARSYGARMYWWGPEIRAFGRLSATQAWAYTCAYLFREVDDLADKAWLREGRRAEDAGQKARSWKNAFRVGAAQTVAIRLDALTREAEASRRVSFEAAREDAKTQKRETLIARVQEAAARAASGEDTVDTTCGPQTPMPTVTALMIVERDEDEVKSEYATWSKKAGMRSGPRLGAVRSRSGYYAGREAGERIKLGGARAGLKAAPGKLEGK